MGSLLIEIGQCGIQIGIQLLENLQSMPSYENNYLFRNDQNVAHSILVDTEPKVLKPALDNRKKYSFLDPKNIIYQQSGRGNNWTIGYFDSKKILQRKTYKTTEKPTNNSEFNLDVPKEELLSCDKYLKENTHLLESVSEMIRKEIEKIDYYMCTMMIYSLGGGTGSGLGSRLLEEMKDDYGGNSIYNTVVFPSRIGESPLQHYNCMLSLAKLQEFSDAVIYFQNDKINSYLSYSLGKKSTDSSINITNINEYIVALLSELLKINDCSLDRFYNDILAEMTPLNDLKYLEIYGTPFQFNKQNNLGPESSWETVINNCLNQVNIEDSEPIGLDNSKEISKSKGNYTNNLKTKGNIQTIASYTLCKSFDIDKSLINNPMILRFMERKINSVLNPVSWNPEAINIEFFKEKQEKILRNKKMMVLANRTNFADILREISNVAYSKYKAKAYLHWYYKYGLMEEDFENCFNIIDNVIESYSEAIY